ncbi:MAG TPA: hypothetical protein VL225_01455 [Vicinamibacterales bacterium]|jgi:hypothetical protein|nr:hypothetical protein [Vicinamibacterales bacterium]
MDPGFRSPLIDFFRRGEVARDVRLLAAQGALAPRAQEQLALLVLLSDDPDPEVARETARTLDALPVDAVRLFLARAETPPEMRTFFAGRGIEAADAPAAIPEFGEPLLDTLSELPEDPGPADPEHTLLSSLSVLERMKLAMKGTREQRAALIRDSNKLVAAAVLSSPKLNESEVEAFTKMGNVSEDVLRVIGQNRGWVKNYGIMAGLCRHPKTPPAISMQLVHRLNEKDLKALSIDRNAKEGLRLLAKKIVSKGKL